METISDFFGSGTSNTFADGVCHLIGSFANCCVIETNEGLVLFDIGQEGLNIQTKRKAVREFSKNAKVFISSEQDLPNELAPYKIPIPPEKMHDVLYFAHLLYGDSATMASESACLGTPAIYIDDIGRFVKTAKFLGIKGIQYKNIQKLKSDLEKLNVKIK